MRRPRLLLTATLAAIAVAMVMTVSGGLANVGSSEDPARIGWHTPTPTPTAGPPASPAAPPLEAKPPPVDVAIEGFLSWALLDRATGTIQGSANLDETSTTESMIKPWIVADHLRRTSEAGDEPSDRELADARRAITDSHDGAAERLYLAGGTNDVVERMIDMCDLTETELYPYFWSRTKMSARDSVKLGDCIADGTAAGPEWTDWVLEQMRKVRGNTDDSDQPMDRGGEGGRWGIIDGLPAPTLERGVSIKNGWTRIGRDQSWHLNCLAITDQWVMAVLMRYPAEDSLDYGAQRCASVAHQLVGSGQHPTVTEPG